MKKNRRANAFLIFIVLAIIGIAIGIFLFYTHRQDEKDKINDILNSEMYIRIDYGLVERSEGLKEKAFFKRTEQDNYYYLYITKDNLLFSYYLDWYYNMDPMQGYKVEQNMELKQKQVDAIMESIKEKAVSDLHAKVESDYVHIYLPDDENDEYNYISKNDLQRIFLDNGVEFNVY